MTQLAEGRLLNLRGNVRHGLYRQSKQFEILNVSAKPLFGSCR